jgi:hypothetical protein
MHRETLERRMSMVPGVKKATADPETRDMLILYDPATVTPARLLRVADAALGSPAGRRRRSDRDWSGWSG